MGNQLSLITPSSATFAIDAYVSELRTIQYEKNLGNARFLKTVRGFNDEGPVVLKVFIKSNPDMDLSVYYGELLRQRQVLTSVSNAFPYIQILETDRAGYLVRQYIKTNVYDRISTRPFLEPIEKLWITFQLLTCLKKCHESKVYHGDIKSENVLVTSWNWVYLSDFASFKPVFLPEDDPSQFSFYFDTSQRRSCYLAPERFLAPGEQKEGELTAAMDIFSLGCVIAELFLEGTHIFSLAQLFKYRKGEYSPVLNEIENEHVKNLVISMTSIDPNDRLSAAQYLDEWKNNLFPNYFYDFLHDFVAAVSTRNHFSDNGKPIDPEFLLDQRVNFIYDHFDKVVSHLGAGEYQSSLQKSNSIDVTRDIVPVLLDLPGWKHVVTQHGKQDITKDDGALIILALITSSLRNVSRSSIKLKGCDLMLALCELINDEAKLDRCLPFFLSLLDDESETVQAAAIRNMTQLLALITVITPMNGGLFPEYIFQRLDSIKNNESVLVRATYASCLPSLAQTASRFLEMGQILKTTGMLESFDPETENGTRTETISYDSYRQGLVSIFESHASLLLTDSSTAVKRAFLKSITPLCIFFGRQMTNDVILTHLITYLNDPDSSLRRQFFDCIIGLGPFIGPTSLEQYIQPLMIQALNDPEEYVISKTFEAFASFAELGLLRKSDIWSILKIAVRYAMHPNSWIRNNVFRFLTASITWMSPAELFCMLNPILKPFLDCEILEFTQANLVRCCKPPLSRPVFNAALLWASKARKSLFWKLPSVKTARVSSVDNDIALALPESFEQVPKSSEDDQWLERLYSMGTTAEELWKVTVLREHIYRVARLSSRLQVDPNSNELTNQVSLSSLQVSPQIIFFNGSQFAGSGEGIVRHGALSDLDDIRDALESKPQTNQSEINITSGNSSLHPTEDSRQRRSGDLQFGIDGAAVIPPTSTTATDTTDVYGMVEQPYSPSKKLSTSQAKYQFPKSNNASGSQFSTDPYISKLMKAVYVESITTEPSDFGSQVVPVLFAEHLHNPASPVKKPNWKPAGVLASQFTEHKSAINKIAISPDHLFFLTCSDDGYIKLWDCPRLEKNVINKSAQTFYCGPTKAKFICFIENTYTFACSCTDGSIQIIRVDIGLSGDAYRPRYRKMTVVRKYQLPTDEYGLWMEHIKTNEASLLIVATTKSRIIGLDLNSMTEKFVFNSPHSHGTPTCFVIDSKKCWLLLGTSLGVLDLWDLRFHLLVKTWTFDDPAPVRRLYLRPKSLGVSVCVLGGTHQSEISLWKIDDMKCTEVYHANQHVEHSRIYQVTKFEEGPGAYRGKAGKFNRKKGQASSDGTRDESNDTELLCMAIGVDSPKDADDNRHIHIVSGGSDRKIRFWDLNSVESSSIVSGLAAESEAVSFFRAYNNAVKVIGEKLIHVTNSNKTSTAASKSSRPSRSARTAIIASEQQDLARNHQASVVDIAILHRPYQMIISADRAGVIKVFI